MKPALLIILALLCGGCVSREPHILTTIIMQAEIINVDAEAKTQWTKDISPDTELSLPLVP